MQTILIKVDPISPDPYIIEQAGNIIRRGGLVAFPTETVYGLAADALNPEAVARVFEVKGRPESKPLPVQVASIDQVATLAIGISDDAVRLMEAFFPGPLTIILQASEQIPETVTAGTGTIGIRMPDHPVALALIRAAGTPIVAPSANPSGLPPPTTAVEVAGYFDGRIDVILDAGPSRIKTPSTVVDLTTTPPKIIREGSITREQIFSRL
jgi:L-threonylcarbamoyladenylate synthase